MRWLLVVAFLAGCAHGPAPRTDEDQQWDDFCRNPPDGNWAAWCANRATQEIAQEQREENARAEKHRRFERSQAVWKASQAPYQPQN